MLGSVRKKPGEKWGYGKGACMLTQCGGIGGVR